MRKVMFFISEAEMKECGLNIVEFHNTFSGIRAVVETNESSIPVQEIPKEKMCYITAICNGSYMYCAAKGTTFNQSLAKRFPESVARKKAAMMSKRGTYQWKVI